MVALAVAPSVFAGLFGNGDPRACELAQSNLGPSGGHPFGFDQQGCDLLRERDLRRAAVDRDRRDRPPLGAAALALVLGTLAGYYGGVGRRA